MSKNTGKKTGAKKKKPSRSPSVNVKRDEKGRLLPGSNLNPSGPPAGFEHQLTILKRSMAAGAKRRGIHLFEHAVDVAYEDNRVLRWLIGLAVGRPAPETTITVETGIAQVVETPAEVDFDILAPEARKHLRALLRIEATRRIITVEAEKQAPGAPGGATEADDVLDVETAEPEKKKATRRLNGPRTSGNGRPGRPNGNGRRRKA